MNMEFNLVAVCGNTRIHEMARSTGAISNNEIIGHVVTFKFRIDHPVIINGDTIKVVDDRASINSLISDVVDELNGMGLLVPAAFIPGYKCGVVDNSIETIFDGTRKTSFGECLKRNGYLN